MPGSALVFPARRQFNPSPVELHNVAADRGAETDSTARAIDLGNELGFRLALMRGDVADRLPDNRIEADAGAELADMDIRVHHLAMHRRRLFRAIGRRSAPSATSA